MNHLRPDRARVNGGAQLASDVVGLIEELRLDAPVLVGHSMGGMTAAVAAAQLGKAVKALVLVDPTFISPEWQREVFESNIAAEHERMLLLPRQELLAQARLRSPNRSAETIEHLIEARIQTSKNAFQVLMPPNPDWRALVQRLCVPTLLVTADNGVVSRQTSNDLTSLNPLLQTQEISDAGHGLPYDHPQRVGAVIASFLNAIAIPGWA